MDGCQDLNPNENNRPAWIEVDLGSISSNIGEIKRRVGESEIMAVVKANAYGHGVAQVSRTAIASGATWLGVATPSELIELRSSGITEPCLVLIEPGVMQGGGVTTNAPTITGSEIDLCIAGDGAFSVCSEKVAEIAAARAKVLGRPARIHIKVDTGMHRMGVSPEEAVPLVRHISRFDSVKIEGVFTHLASADEIEKRPTKTQLDRFSKTLSFLDQAGLRPPIAHAANSAGAICCPDSHHDMVRIGIAMYGLHPGEATKDKIELSPALSLRARVARVHTVPAGEGVSYGANWIAPEPTKICTVSLGYGDGYSRAFSDHASVLVGGERRPVRGRVCMDQIMFEVPRDHQIEAGDTVTIIGRDGEEEVSVDDLAQIAGTINYEITTGLTSRLPRFYVASGQQ